MNATTRTYASHRTCTHGNTAADRRRCRDAQALIAELRAKPTSNPQVFVLPRPVGRPRKDATRTYLVILPGARVARIAA